jgi:hypothetical protein
MRKYRNVLCPLEMVGWRFAEFTNLLRKRWTVAKTWTMRVWTMGAWHSCRGTRHCKGPAAGGAEAGAGRARALNTEGMDSQLRGPEASSL